MARLTIYGIGVNDIGSEACKLRSYKTWRNIIKRCYMNGVGQERSYYDCSVSSDWLKFSSFMDFYDKNYRNGLFIDKDLLSLNSKEYSSKTCCFISVGLNNFVTDKRAVRGSLAIGVSRNITSGNLRACIRHSGKYISIGVFGSELDAHKAWFREKIKFAAEFKDECNSINERAYAMLMTKVRMLRERGLKP